jgi:hypothetical protein
MAGLHLTEACEGGLQHTISGCLGDGTVEAEREPVELLRLINY